MYLMKAGWETLRLGLTPWKDVNGMDVLRQIESVGRLCYKSEDKINDSSAISFMRNIIARGHFAMLDHFHISAKYVCDRGVSHEYLRHKLTEILGSGCVEPVDDYKPMAAMQESTRYCNYMKKDGVCFIIPPWVNIPEGEYYSMADLHKRLRIAGTEADNNWFVGCLNSEQHYMKALELGWTPQMARGELAIKVKTEFIVTCSLTEWRYLFYRRTPKDAHPQMYELMRPQLDDMKAKIPIIFDDIVY